MLRQLIFEVSSLLDQNQFAYGAERGVEAVILTMINTIYEQLEQDQNLVRNILVDCLQLHLIVRLEALCLFFY